MEKIQNLPAHIRLLTEGEMRVFKQLGMGKSPTEAALALFLSPKTISTHRNNICCKMGFKDTNALIFYYVFQTIRQIYIDHGCKVPAESLLYEY